MHNVPISLLAQGDAAEALEELGALALADWLTPEWKFLSRNV